MTTPPRDRRSRSRPTLAALAALALLAACGGSSGATTPSGGGAGVSDPPVAPVEPTEPSTPVEPVTPAASSVAVAFAASLPDGAFTPVAEAAIGSTPSLWVVADWTGAAADQVERLVLTSPLGSVYYAPEIALDAPEGSLVRTAVLPDGTRRVAFQLLIWGTEIEAYAEVGTWTAAVSLVGGDAAGSASVVLR